MLTLNGANTYSGTTSFYGNSVKLTLGNQYAVQDSTINYSLGTITFANGITAANMAGIYGSRPLALTNNASAGVNLIVGGVPSTPAYTMVYSGALSGSGGGLTLNGGTLQISGNNTYTARPWSTAARST